MDIAELERIGFLTDLTEEDRDALGSVFSDAAYPVGTALIVEGGDPTTFFVLLDGHVTVHRAGSHLADLGPGDCFGEVGVVARESSNATVISTTQIRVAKAMGWDLRDLLASRPELRARIESTIAARTPDA